MQLRPYQEEAKQAILGEWNKGINRTLLVLPTGCGKTIVFAKVTEEQVKQGDRVLILAHRFELLQQACDKIEQATGLKSAMEKAEYTCMGSWYRVVVGSVQTLMREKRLNGFAKDFFDTIMSTKHIMYFQIAIRRCWNILTALRCLVLLQRLTEAICVI